MRGKGRRCPPEQTIGFNKLLKIKGVKTDARKYPNVGHKVNSVEAEIYSLFAMSEWWIDNFNF